MSLFSLYPPADKATADDCRAVVNQLRRQNKPLAAEDIRYLADLIEELAMTPTFCDVCSEPC